MAYQTSTVLPRLCAKGGTLVTGSSGGPCTIVSQTLDARNPPCCQTMSNTVPLLLV